MTRTVKLTVAYDGAAYAGWQTQPDLPTVQAVLEAALSKLLGEAVRVRAAGRTDAGVHALGQVAAFRTRSTIPPDRFGPALRPLLPADVTVLRGERVADDFHATRDAVRKTYRYVVLNRESPDPLLAGRVWWLRPLADGRGLDLPAMADAAASLVGTHDFAGFQTQGSPRPDTVRTLFDVSVRRCAGWNLWHPRRSDEPAADDDPGPFVVVEVTGDGFLYNMVRTIAGTLVDVGRHRRDVDSVAALLDDPDRTHAGPTAPAGGLYLVRVEYDA